MCACVSARARVRARVCVRVRACAFLCVCVRAYAQGKRARGLRKLSWNSPEQVSCPIPQAENTVNPKDADEEHLVSFLGGW